MLKTYNKKQLNPLFKKFGFTIKETAKGYKCTGFICTDIKEPGRLFFVHNTYESLPVSTDELAWQTIN